MSNGRTPEGFVEARRNYNQARAQFVLNEEFDKKPLSDEGFKKEALSNSCIVYLPTDEWTRKEDVLNFPAFKDWLKRLLNNLKLQDDPAHTFHKDKYMLKGIDIQAADWFHPKKLGFLKLQAQIANSTGSLPGAVFLRGGSVGMLLILEAYDPANPDKRFDRKTVLTVQPRIPTGSLALAEIPAGMLDGDNNFAGKAAAEIKEEVGITIKAHDLVDMSKLATANTPIAPWAKGKTPTAGPEDVANSMYPSAGGCDEFLPLLLCQKRITVDKMEALDGKATGLRNEGEMITLKVIPLGDLWKEGARDAKALAALALYEGLKREEKLPEMPTKPDA